jgi:hypothetical protein
MQVAKAPKEGEEVKDTDVLINCTFTMVSLDPGTKKYESDTVLEDPWLTNDSGQSTSMR